MENVAKVLKVVTATTVFYVVAHRVTLAKCAKSGKFVSRADAQWLFDNIATLSMKINENRMAGNRVCNAYKELSKAIVYFGLSLINDDTKKQFKAVWLGILNQTCDHRWDEPCFFIAA